MRAMVCHRLTSDRSGLAFAADWPEPPLPGSNEVTVAVAHVGLNYLDLLMLSGGYQFAPSLPFVPGVEASGTVIAIGSAVDPALLGAEVVVGARSGLMAERVTVAAASVRRRPHGLSARHAAAFTVAALTAYVALVRRGRVRAGEQVIVTGAGGGTGLAAVALAKLLGCGVVGIVSSAAKGRAAQVAGADAIVIAGRGAVSPPLHAIDVVFDPVGGVLSAPLLRSLRRGGRYLAIGFVGGIAAVDFATVSRREIEVIGVRAGEFARRDPVAGAANIAAIDAMAPRLVPHLGCCVGLAEADAALAAMASGTLIGKAVIDV